MAKGRIKVKEGELLDDDHIELAITTLDEGGTKKEACSILNINYNSTRLQKIIDDYHERKERDARLRKEKRGTPATDFEVTEIIRGALEGTALATIANDLYRPVDFVKRILDGVGIPRKLPGTWYDRLYLSSIPDQCVSERFNIGELVWSDKYQSLSIVRDETLKKDGTYSYQIFVIEKMDEDPPWALNGIVYRDYGGFYANQPAHELGSLEHLKKFGIDLYKPYRQVFGKWFNENSVSE